MGFADLFQHVTEWSAKELRQFLASHHPADYQLIDVSQLQEYGEQHLPGAHWIPAEELPRQWGKLDKAKPTIVYCAHGIRSHAACQVLIKAGFDKVYNLRGGLRAWQGHAVVGLPKRTTDFFEQAENAADAALLAWQIEENTRRFYEELADTLDEPDSAALFAELAAAESHHKTMLKAIWEALTSRQAPADFPLGLMSQPCNDLLEGGMHLDELLDWIEGRTVDEIIELAIAMEMNAYDHYLTMQRTCNDADISRMFELLANEERHHLKTLGESLEQHLPYAD